MRPLVLWLGALMLMLAGCEGNRPPPAAPAERVVHVIEADEAGDEWLHRHCQYKGTIVAEDEADSRARALRQDANVIVPMVTATHSEEHSRNTVSSTTSSRVTGSKMFDCKTLPLTKG